MLRGVFLSDEPLTWQEGAAGDALLEVTLREGIDLAGFELVEDTKPYREWCVPAALLNELATLRLVEGA